ncbi:hypothetical protein [Aliarcobacter cryaerophilus]|uniref:hypothetical protein n=1 Tax=Aliarcobacter cryaerophilus TaxID=28198 RepID=UPI0021B4EC1A|nr:hypothetical protein [Aliarcobacter cryaerophilus]MCT7531341.1 hypothetical protein [Aliarcobacter cryaerophilus]
MSHKIAIDRYNSIIKRNAMARITLNKNGFEIWYGVDSKDRQCEYCLIRESEIKDLINQGKIYTKRLTTRGRTMEVDRRDPKGHYQINNLVMSCYWCNNAKTDEFSYEEFRKMSCRTNDIWKARLNSNPSIAQLMNSDKLRCDWNTPKGIVLVLPWGINANSANKSINNSDWEIVRDIISKLLNHIPTNNERGNLDKDFKIYLVYKDVAKYSSIIGNLIQSYQLNTNIVFLPIPHLDSIWINGCMPLKVISENNADNKALKAVYSPSFYNNNCFKDCGKDYRKHAYYEHVSALEIAEALDLQIRYISINGGGYWYEGLICKDFKKKKEVENYEDGSIIDENRPIILDNNDFVHNGTVGFISQRVLEENCATCEGKNKFLVRFMKYTNLKKICVLQTKVAQENNCNEQTSDEYGFLSDKIRFLNETTLLIKKCFYEEINLEECCKTAEDFCEEENINIKEVSFDLDYLRVGNLILHNNKISETPNELMFKDFIFKKIESDESLFSISWVF